MVPLVHLPRTARFWLLLLLLCRSFIAHGQCSHPQCYTETDYAANDARTTKFRSKHDAFQTRLLHIHRHSKLLVSKEFRGYRPPPPPPYNLVFIKTLKVGGSSVGGVIRHIAHHQNLSGTFSDTLEDIKLNGDQRLMEPFVFASTSHLAPLQRQFRQNKLETVLVGWIRDPLARCMSSYYYFHCQIVPNSDGLRQVSHSTLVIIRGHPLARSLLGLGCCLISLLGPLTLCVQDKKYFLSRIKGLPNETSGEGDVCAEEQAKYLVVCGAAVPASHIVEPLTFVYLLGS